MSELNLHFKMNLPEQLLAQAEEFRIYAAAECKPASKEQWIKWAETCEAAAKDSADAARYRHMRSSATFRDKNGPGLYWYLPRFREPGTSAEQLDAAIDAEMKP